MISVQNLVDMVCTEAIELGAFQEDGMEETKKVKGSAILSKCGKYRYELRRTWNRSLPPFVAVMLNPSTADANRSDPTVTRCLLRAQDLEYGELIVLNLGAGRATDPRKWKAMKDPIGPENDKHIERVFKECKKRKGIVLVGWGTHGGFMERDLTVYGIANRIGVKMMSLGATKDSHPRHPLYVSYRQRLLEV